MDKNLALETLKSFVENTDNVIAKDAILALHPELAENEDEKVRKALLRCCDDWEKGQFGCMAKEDIPAVRTYLEKLKEQKSLSTEETEQNSIAFLEQMGYTCIPPGKEQPAEWSEEDEEIRGSIISRLETLILYESSSLVKAYVEKEIKWLKSLRPQPHWKPSEEQMIALKKAICYLAEYGASDDGLVLDTLYDELKKLYE